jgi:hypothetical protein
MEMVFIASFMELPSHQGSQISKSEKVLEFDELAFKNNGKNYLTL